MTAKEALRQRVDDLSEEEAEEWLARMEWESTTTEELAPEEMAAVLAAEREVADGHTVDGEDLFRRLNL